MTILYTPEARHDLISIRQYILENFFDDLAAKRLTKKIVERIALLEANPEMGVSLQKRVNRETDLQLLLIDKHIAFYRVLEDEIQIIRILDTRMDYMKEIF